MSTTDKSAAPDPCDRVHFLPIEEQLARAIEEATKWTDRDGKPWIAFMSQQVTGADLVLPDGRRIAMRCEWLEIPADPRAAYYAARHLMRLAGERRGAVWFCGDPVHIIRDGGGGKFVLPGPDGGGCCRVRTLYYPEALAV